VEVTVAADATTLAAVGADRVRSYLDAAIAIRGRASLALSGGTSPAPLIAALARVDLDWSAVDVFQVDERWVHSASPDRNWTAIDETLIAPTGARGHRLTVSGGHVRHASRQLLVMSDASRLKDLLGPTAVLDVVHLGLGGDGHTASWPPGAAMDSLVEATTLVERIENFRAFDRTTLTPAIVNRARQVIWYVTGAAKSDVLSRLVAGDLSIPAGHVRGPHQEIFTDLAEFSSP